MKAPFLLAVFVLIVSSSVTHTGTTDGIGFLLDSGGSTAGDIVLQADQSLDLLESSIEALQASLMPPVPTLDPAPPYPAGFDQVLDAPVQTANTGLRRPQAVSDWGGFPGLRSNAHRAANGNTRQPRKEQRPGAAPT